MPFAWLKIVGRALLVLIVAWAWLWPLGLEAWADSRHPHFRLLENRPFATVADGPLSAYVVEAKPDARGAIQRAAADLSAQFSSPGLYHLLEVLGRSRPGLMPPAFTETVLVKGASGRSTLAQAGGGEITFRYEGWGAADQSRLTDFVNQVYPICKQVYGQPAFTITVAIIQDSGVQDLLGGFYVPTTHEIHLPPITGSFQAAAFALTQLILAAFHDQALLGYDAWEKGFTRAAGTICMRQADPTFDPLYEPFYILPLYDLLNQPALGNSTFYPSSGFIATFPWRVGMSAAAWLKVYTEYPNFFRDFNTEYYRRLDPENIIAVSGNVYELRDIAASAASEVEALPFQEWFEHQFVLDTSITGGDKFFIYSLPQQNSVLLIVNYYSTATLGNEQPKGGTVNLDYYDYTHTYSLFAAEGYRIDIPDTGTDAGQGFLAPTFFNIGIDGAQRVFVELKLGNLFRTVYYPYEVSAPGGSQRALFGTVLGDDSGSTLVSLIPGGSDSFNAHKGAFTSAAIAFPISGLAQLAINYTNANGQDITLRRNVGFGYYVVQFPNAGQRQSYSHVFPPGVQLIGIPFYPANPEPSAFFGIAAGELLLGEYAPGQARLGGRNYKLYPEVARLQPGHAYWLKLPTTLSLGVQGSPTPTNTAFRVELLPGWNTISNPFTSTVPVNALQFESGTEGPIPYDQAVSRGWISANFYIYTPATGVVSTDRMDPWLGVWIRVTITQSVTVLIPPP